MAGSQEPTGGVATGIGRTALMVAAARAIETHRPDSLAQDCYAEHFVRAAGVCAGWPVRPEDVPGGDANPLWGRLGRYFGLRTRVFDDFLRRAARGGARQIVVLGAGLDTRAYRLEWPTGCVVFLLDRAPVLDFSRSVLASVGAVTPTPCRWIAADLRDQAWPGALAAAGFDASAPSAWLAEGLLLYLPAEAETRLMSTVDLLAAPGSVLAYEVKLGLESPAVRDSPVYTTTKEQIGIDLLALFDRQPRPDTLAALIARGWFATGHSPFEFTRLHRRGPEPEHPDALAANRWVFAAKPPAGHR
ncbi:SAM-dependent methyltransferase [Amycolatopsis sp. PS_44_ISF1]|uniref:SAM-dependent methyltransferase n=1 Tax=Amycolatopsis sp. PS_44_ISF1 TaxID=2974917 RepID=UPI0028E02960|nr:SAM-dependent methyltransferase [Amycolatopsis sp. PS_44_ISF1]MDT8913225.1 SAM-dependent methyltransferase [Amycolatopsis sp. PS_44_ISF1]